MIKSRVAWVWLAALVLGAAIGYLQLRHAGDSDADGDGHALASGPRMLMPAPMDEIGAIEIVYGGQLHRFERDAQATWLYHVDHGKTSATHQHQGTKAAGELIDKALNGFGRARLERDVPVDKQRDNFGVNSPQMIILVYSPGGKDLLAQYGVGTVAADTLSRYIIRVGSDTVHTIANFHIELLVELINTAQKLASTPDAAEPAATK